MEQASNETPTNFFICARNVVEATGEFGNEPGPTLYLVVPDGETPNPDSHSVERADWLKTLRGRASSTRCPVTGAEAGDANAASNAEKGDILVFVHGYNNSLGRVMRNHDLLQRNLGTCGFSGAVVSFDWPSADSAINYLEDRSDARATAERLVLDGIRFLAFGQRDQDADKCEIDVHVLAHSTGAYVVREAFYFASQSRAISRINWNVSQVAFIGADVARSGMAATNWKSQALFRHSTRITNHQNRYDSILKLSNVKRLGTKPRVGRVGLPEDAPSTAVNVSTGSHWKGLKKPKEVEGSWPHSWYFHDLTFAKDLAYTLSGDVDRHVVPTRRWRSGQLSLAKERRG